MKNLTEEQVKDVQERIKVANEEVTAVLKKHELNIGAKIVAIEVAPGVYGNTVNVGYTDVKYAEKPEVKAEKVIKED